MERNKLILVTGGARSGKSKFAEQMAEQAGLPVTYIATAQIFDEEMRARVQTHQARRAQHWSTREAPFDAAVQVKEAGNATPVILLDCLTLYVSNHLLRGLPDGDVFSEKRHEHVEQVLAAVDQLISAAKSVPARVIIVTNEVGAGIVPDNALSRMFRDAAGLANQRVAAAADEVYVMISGLPLRLK